MEYAIIAALVITAAVVIAVKRQRWLVTNDIGQERLKAMLEYEAQILLPEGRNLAFLSESAILVDLALSRVANLVIFEPKENVVRVLGSPQVHEDILEMYIYPHRGMCFEIVRDRVRIINLWFTSVAASKTLSKELPDFAPCNVVVVGRGDGTYHVQPGDTRSTIVSALGMPDDEDGPYSNGVTLLKYFGKVSGEGCHRLHLEFNLESDGKLSSMYITH